jgi:hypothetical protein
LPRKGVEPLRLSARDPKSQENQENHGFSDTSAPEGAVEGAVDSKIDADLQRVLDTWPTLPEALRAGILAMIAAATK